MDLHGGFRIPVTINTTDGKALENIRLASGNNDGLLALKAHPDGTVNKVAIIQGPAYDGVTVGQTVPEVFLEADVRPGEQERFVAVRVGDINLFPADTTIVDATVGTEEEDV
jgi:hypothetical protein